MSEDVKPLDEEELKRIMNLTARAIAAGHPVHLALAAAELHLSRALAALNRMRDAAPGSQSI